MRPTVARRRARVFLRAIYGDRRDNSLLSSASRRGRGQGKTLKRHNKCDKAEQNRANASEALPRALIRFRRMGSDLPHHRCLCLVEKT